MLKYYCVSFLLLCSVSGFAQPGTIIDSLKAVISKGGNDTAVAWAYSAWGGEMLLSNPDSALKLYFMGEKVVEEALKNNAAPSSKLNWPLRRVQASLLNDIGYVYDSKVNIPKALNYYYSSLKIREELGDKYGIAEAMNNIGLVYRNYFSGYADALRDFEKALKLFREVGHKHGESVVLHNLSDVYYQMGDSTKALDYSLQSLKISREMNDKQEIAGGLNNIANIYKSKNDLPKALEYYNESLKMRREIDDKEGLANTLNNLGAIYFEKGEMQKAKEMAEQSMAISTKFNYALSTRLSALLLQKIYSREGRWKEAYTMYDLYFQLRDQAQKRETQLSALRQQAKYEYQKQSITDSIKFNSAQREKDLKIQQQKTMLQSEKNIRNSILFIGLLVLIILVLLFNRYRIRLNQKQDRMQIATLQTEQKLLRAQMNPHFIFNSLNSIQNLILENSPRMARECLVKFSKLMRAVLDQTRREFISLNEEIETLRLYLDMENLRLGDKFDYDIRVSDSNTTDNIVFPPLLIQPFVENAIIHGISHMEGRGLIGIEFRRNNGILHCSITDNGIGREEAAKVSQSKEKLSVSVATQLAQNRLKAINGSKSENSGVTILDMRDEHGHPKGTKVEISIVLDNSSDV